MSGTAGRAFARRASPEVRTNGFVGLDRAIREVATSDMTTRVETNGRRHLLIDLASSYALSVARVGSNAAIVGFLYRHTTPTWVAAFVLMRSMLAIVTYLCAGLAPAVLREMNRDEWPTPIAEVVDHSVTRAESTLSYANPRVVNRPLPDHRPASRRFNALLVSIVLAGTLVVAALFYAGAFRGIHQTGIPSGESIWFFNAVSLYAIGLILRGTSDAAGGALQWRGRLWLDNLFIIAGEIGFTVWALCIDDPKFGRIFESIGQAFAVTGAMIAIARWFAAGITKDNSRGARFDAVICSRLFAAAAIISVGSFSDFLYAPTNCLIIDRWLGAKALAEYAPALQIDGAMLLTIAAIAPTLMPRVAAAVRNGDFRAVRKMYLLATVGGLATLIACAIVVLVGRDVLLHLWLGEAPAATAAILPFVLVHTVVGGTAGVGRATLLAMGRFRAYTVSAVIGGVANVGLALLFVGGFGWGLRGVALATIVAVVARCAIWMPWYILRATRYVAPAPR